MTGSGTDPTMAALDAEQEREQGVYDHDGEVGHVTLTEFLSARLDEDEAAARALGSKVDTARLLEQSERVAKAYGNPGPLEDDINLADSLWWNVRDAVAWAEMWPASRVLADVAAKRRIVALHRLVYDDTIEFTWKGPIGPGSRPTGSKQGWGCDNCRVPTNDGDAVVVEGPCPTLRLLALPFAEHPDYDESWRV